MSKQSAGVAGGVAGALECTRKSAPSVPEPELNAMGIRYIPCQEVADMMEAQSRGQPVKSFAVIDLRSGDYTGGHVQGSVNIPAADLIRDVMSPGVDSSVQALQGVQCVIFHCLISRHRAPHCAKFYKKKLNQLGRQQEVLILEGGYWVWKEQFRGNPAFIADDEGMNSEQAQQRLTLGQQLGQQFVAQNANSSPMNGCPQPSQQQLSSDGYPSRPRQNQDPNLPCKTQMGQPVALGMQAAVPVGQGVTQKPAVPQTVLRKPREVPTKPQFIMVPVEVVSGAPPNVMEPQDSVMVVRRMDA